MSEAKRHHYIPQFILKNFLDNKGQVFYWDIEKEVLEKRNPRSIFMNFDMYSIQQSVIQFNRRKDTKKGYAILEKEIESVIAEE